VSSLWRLQTVPTQSGDHEGTESQGIIKDFKELSKIASTDQIFQIVNKVNMESIEELEKCVEGKFKLLAFISEDTGRVMEQGDVKAMERQARALERNVEKIHEIKLQLQEVKIEGGCEPTEVREWTKALEDKLSKYENDLKTIKREVAGIENQEKEAIEEDQRKRLFDKEIKLQEAKLQRQFEMEERVSRRVSSPHPIQEILAEQSCLNL